ncbi:phage minor tail protein L [Helicobacter pylori]|uniref:phage minor tail protein L n=1 Tax=Helicobacter pylori TaxID=210 RepID=UPI002AC41A5D|nr:phage minor tail protein L [Helicobacter pylori]MDZ5288558.1 phage minor tail protein L [Helicobacter pylori]
MLNSDFQKLSVAGIVTLYELDATTLGGGIVRWHGHVGREDWQLINGEAVFNRDIVWQGKNYSPVAIDSDGLEMRGDGKASTPSIVISNTINNINGAMSALCLRFNDFAGAKLTVITTLAKYLDAANFTNGNPSARNEYKRQVWFVEQKTQENFSQVTFELSNPVDFEGLRIPCREITNYCHWAVCGRYRGVECKYTGGYFDKNANPTNNPALDYCTGQLKDCKVRDNTANFGGFPSSSLS